MEIKSAEKEKAISLRKKGFSYAEILKEVSVAKSTLSLWLRSVGLSKRHEQRITEKKRLAGLRGARKRHQQKLLKIEEIYKEAELEITQISNKSFWLMGIMLYWAEGSKEKDNHPGSGIKFSNSDPLMIRMFIKWLVEFVNINIADIKFEIYIHENSKNSIKKVKEFWARATGLGLNHFNTVYFKRNKIKIYRNNTGDSYFGLLSIRVKRSSGLSRKIAGWIRAINNLILPGGVFGNTPAFEAGDTRFEP